MSPGYAEFGTELNLILFRFKRTRQTWQPCPSVYCQHCYVLVSSVQRLSEDSDARQLDISNQRLSKLVRTVTVPPGSIHQCPGVGPAWVSRSWEPQPDWGAVGSSVSSGLCIGQGRGSKSLRVHTLSSVLTLSLTELCPSAQQRSQASP